MSEDRKEQDPIHQGTETPFGKINRHRKELDNALASIKGYTDESKLTRMFIVGQIEALDYVARMFEV